MPHLRGRRGRGERELGRKKFRGENPVNAASSPPRVGSPAVIEHPVRAGNADRLVMVRVVQATLACLTRLVQRGMHCIRVVTHPRSRWNVWDWGPRSARWVLVAEPIVLGWVAVETVRAILAGIGSPD